MEENKKYIVKVLNFFSNLIEIEAANEDEARLKAKEIILNEDSYKEDIPLVYETTIPHDHWPVIEKEKFEELKKSEANQ